MKKYRIYLIAGASDGPKGTEEDFLEFPDDTPQKKIDEDCEKELAELIGDIEKGWYEVK